MTRCDSDGANRGVHWEVRTARRLVRLFRMERAGRFDRRPAATVRRLVERRQAVIEALLAALLSGGQAAPARGGGPLATLLDRALAELQAEVRLSRLAAEARRDRLAAALRRGGDRAPGGARAARRGRLLGRG